MPPKRNMTMTIEEKSAIGIASNYGKAEAKAKPKAKPKAKNTKTFVSKMDVVKPRPRPTTFTPLSIKPAKKNIKTFAPLPEKKQKEPTPKGKPKKTRKTILGKKKPTFVPMTLTPGRHNRFPKTQTARQENTEVPTAVYRAYRMPTAGYGKKFTVEESGVNKRLPTYPAVPDPEKVGFGGTPGGNKLNMFHGRRSVFVARTQEQAVNFISEGAANRNSTWAIYKISNPSQYDVIRVEPYNTQASTEASIERVANAYKKQYGNSDHWKERMEGINKSPAARREVAEAFKVGAAGYVNNTAEINGEHVLKGPVKPKDIKLVAMYKISSAHTGNPIRTTPVKTGNDKLYKYDQIETRLSKMPNYRQVRDVQKRWQEVHKEVLPRLVNRAVQTAKNDRVPAPPPPPIDRHN